MRNGTLKTKNNTAALNVIFFCLIMALLLSFSACDNSLSTRQTTRGTGSVTLIIGEADGRTILPGTDQSIFSSYTLELYAPGNTTTALYTFERPQSSSYTIVLETGTYDLLVSAWRGSGKTQLAAQGRLNGIIVDETVINTYTVTLGTLMNSGETGTFRWSISFPAGLKSASMTITPVNSSTGTAQEIIEIPVTQGSPFSASRILNVGYYTVTFELERNDKDYQKIVFHEILHIYQNLDSSYTYTFRDDDFSAIKHSVTFVYDNGTTPDLSADYWHDSLISEADRKPAINKPIPAGLYQPTPPAACTFNGWYASGVPWNFNNPVTGNMTLTAHWNKAANLVDISAETGDNDVTKAVNYVINHPGQYTLLAGASDPAANTSVNIGNHILPAGCNLTIKGMGTGERGILGASAASPLFTIEGGAVLTLDSGITLYGTADGTTSLISVTNGSLIMETGSKITGHTTSSPNGAVHISSGAPGTNSVFTMKGGEITGNRSTSAAAESAGGVYAAGSQSVMNMEGGSIYRNTIGIASSSPRPGDVFTENGSSLNLSGDAHILYLTLRSTAPDTGANAVITIVPIWSGSVSSLNLYAIIPAITDVITYWKNKVVLQGVVNESTVVKITLGNFISSDGSTKPITEANPPEAPGGYMISTEAGELGKLIVNNLAARIDSKNYRTLYAAITDQDALSNDKDNPTEIVILRDITAPETGMAANTGYTIPENKHIKLTVELNQSRTITASAGGFSLFSVSNNSSSLTLEGKGDKGILTLNGGDAAAVDNRHGVNVSGSGRSFTLNDGVNITGFNIISTGSGGGGVYIVSNAAFTMNGGKISGNNVTSNTAAGLGGGVYVGSSGTFTMYDGVITDNTSSNQGGGVYIASGIFTMEGGKIIDNTVTNNGNGGGGGVYVAPNGIFEMNGGYIIKNTSNNKGGGVCVGGNELYSGTFTMSGGTIYGTNEADTSLRNNAPNGGAALYNDGGTANYDGDYGGGKYTANNVIPTGDKTIPGTPSPPPPQEPGDIIISDTGFHLAWIPAETFIMGSPNGEEGSYSYERPQHSVTLTKSFYMGIYQVTQEQYQEVMKTNPSSMKTAVTGESGTPGKLPVERVSWYDALVFCNKLSDREGLDPVYKIKGSTDPAVWGTVPTTGNNVDWDAAVMDTSKNGYRLPTEAEWEYACRAGTTTTYNTGENTVSDNTGWYLDNSSRKTHQVGLKPANAWGLYDMHGNVDEWCWDWYNSNYYSSSPSNDPEGPLSGDERVYRGGNYEENDWKIRSAYRYHTYPYLRYSNQGFRLVRTRTAP